MADEPTEEQQETEQPSESTFSPINSQEALDRIIGQRLAREQAKYADYADLKAKAARLDEIEDANKTELQRITERVEAAEREREQARAESLRLRVAVKHGISDEDADLFLTGTDEETLTRQAERLAARADKPRAPRPTAAQDGGEPPPSGDWLRAQFARS